MTVHDYLKTLPQDIYESALYYASEENNNLDIPVEDLETAVSGAFIWTNTIEGHKYWRDISKGDYKKYYW